MYQFVPYAQAKTLRGRKDTLAPVFFIGGGGDRPLRPPRIDATDARHRLQRHELVGDRWARSVRQKLGRKRLAEEMRVSRYTEATEDFRWHAGWGVARLQKKGTVEDGSWESWYWPRWSWWWESCWRAVIRWLHRLCRTCAWS